MGPELTAGDAPMSPAEVELHARRPLPLPMWPDDDGPYWDWAAYRQVIIPDPTREEIAQLEAYRNELVNRGYEVDLKIYPLPSPAPG